MAYSHVAYIDESGDDGCSGPYRVDSGHGGQSHFLIVGAYIVSVDQDKSLVGIRDHIRDSIKPHAQRIDLHFSGLNHAQKIRYCQMLASKPANIICVIVQKAGLNKRDFSKNAHQLYWYACRMLVERISWLCDDLTPGSAEKRVRLVFSNRGGMSYSDFSSYLTNLQGIQTQIRWQCIDASLVDSQPHRKLAGLQFADAANCGISSCVEPQNFGVLEPRYGKELSPLLFRYRGRRLWGYGIKVFPSRDGLSDEQNANLDALI